MIIPVILAGGSGSRLWPLSRQLNPKQFINLPGLATADQPDFSLFQSTLVRLKGLPGLLPPLVICNEEHRFLVAEQLRQLGIDDGLIVLEPEGRNTAPAVTVAAGVIRELVAPRLPAEEPLLMLVLPADHVIGDLEVFHDCVRRGAELAATGNLVTFGIKPRYAETGYGYIQRAQSLGCGVAASEAFRVQRFVEKPDAERALAYLEDGSYDWNSGMFLFELNEWLAQIARFAPQMAEQCTLACSELKHDGDFVRIGREAFAACPADSIDYAVMEKTAAAAVVAMDAEWNDLGAWNAVWEINANKNGANNVIQGDAHVIDVHNSYIHAGARLVVAIGLKDVVVVETADAVLVADRQQVQDVKKAVQWLEQHRREEARLHTLVYRPWGSYESLATGPGFQVKRIRVKPGAALSLQMHHQRAEHWVVIQGVATVTCDNRTFELQPNESTFIPLGSKHRLQNKTSDWVELIEVQTGAYLGEDDIVRFDDVYGRVPAV